MERTKYYTIEGSLTSEEFQREFRRIRDQFVAELERHVGDRTVAWARACDGGRSCLWLWDNEAFEFTNRAGTYEDAKEHLRWAIDQGYKTAFMGSLLQDGRLAIWVTHWEDPDGTQRPVWPSEFGIMFEDFFNGIG